MRYSYHQKPCWERDIEFQVSPICLRTAVSIPEFTWKIVVPLEAGQRINNIKATTEVIAIMVPNRAGLTTPNVNFPLPGENSRTITNWNRWQDWRVSIDYLENLTGYNFLSELPDSIQKAIESRDNGLLPNGAPLMADSNSVSSSVFNYIGDDFSIRKASLGQVTAAETININDGIIENTSSKKCFAEDSSSKVGFLKPNIFHPRIGQDSILEIGSVHNGISDCSPIQVNSSENGITQINIFDDGITQTSVDEVSITQIDVAKASIRNISIAQINSSQVSVLNLSLSQFNSTKIPGQTHQNQEHMTCSR
jgi:DNA/RNA non-specific endonuclease